MGIFEKDKYIYWNNKAKQQNWNNSSLRKKIRKKIVRRRFLLLTKD